jgi:spectinomycin phosphotransferase
MLERADLEEEKIIACLQDDYGLLIKEVAFLPLGADRDTAVYRLIAADETPYFLKLRKGVFDETSVALPQFLSSLGITQIIPPLTTKSGRIWGNLDTFKTILYPYIEGHNGYEADLFDHHWRDLGTALKRIHTADVPTALISRIRQESYSPCGRDTVKRFLARIEHKKYDDHTAVQLAAYLQTKRAEILDLVGLITIKPGKTTLSDGITMKIDTPAQTVVRLSRLMA